MGSKAWWLFVVAFAIGLVATLLVIRERVPGEIARQSTGKPPLVVGVMPAGAIDATVLVGSASVHPGTRGRWFLASPEPGALGPKNDAQVVVKFDKS